MDERGVGAVGRASGVRGLVGVIMKANGVGYPRVFWTFCLKKRSWGGRSAGAVVVVGTARMAM